MSIRITLTPTSHSVDFEVGSPSEGIGFIEENGAAMTRLLEVLDRLPKGDTALATGTVVTSGDMSGTIPAEPARRGRKPRNAGGDPATATAPPPIAVPGAPAAPPVAPTPPGAPAAPAGTDGFAIPAFLDRTNQAPPAAPAPAAPPAAPAPAAPPPPPAPPSGVLAERIIPALEARKVGSPDAPKQLADWLASCKLVIPGVSYDEAIAVLRLQPDEKLQILLAPLGL